MTGVAELIRHIRAHPGESDPVKLASQFGVDAAIVAAALAKTQPRPPRPRAVPFGARAKDALTRLWLKATERPVLFLVVTSLLAIGALRLYSSLPVTFLARVPSQTNTNVWSLIMFGTPFLQLSGIARLAKFRYVVLGAGIYLLTMVLYYWASGGAKDSQFQLVAVSMTAMSVLYLILGVPFMIVGAYRRVKRERREYERMSRQQILDRLLQVRQALAGAQQPAPKRLTRATRFWPWCERHRFFLAPTFAFLTSTLMSSLMLTLDPDRSFIQQRVSQQAQLSSATGILAIAMLLSLFVYATQFFLGVLCRKFSEMLTTMLLYAVGYVLAAMMPTAYVPFGENGRIGWGNYALGVSLQGAMIVVGYLGRLVSEHTILAERRRANDPVALAEELVELEWRLVPTTTKVTVMAVDVVGSTAMKRNADPLVAEWSFREYQSWIASVCADFGGRVRSTAGDGAILGFETAENAIAASKCLLNKLGEFNSEKNRLPEPFRIRIGLHCGDVQGDLGDVQFTRVIDVAAHIEAKAPAGGLAVSETVVEAVGMSEFLRAAVTVDGHDVFVLNQAPS